MNRVRYKGNIETQAKDEIRDLIESGHLQGHDLYAMGSLANAANLDRILKKYGLRLSAVVDNNPDKAGKYEMPGGDITIIHSSDFVKNYRNDNSVMLILSIRFWREMADQMLEYGFTEGKDLYILEAPSLEKKIKYIRRGSELVDFFEKKYGRNVTLVVFHGPVGDNYFFSLYVREYCRQNNIENPVFLGIASTSKIIEIFGFSPYWELKRDDVVALEYLYSFKDDNNIKILQIWEFNFHFNRCRIRFDRRFNFLDTYKHYVFNFDKGILPEFPENKALTENTRSIFEKNDLRKGRTFILAPYAYSIEKQPDRLFWKALAELIKENDFDVAVNIDPRRKERNFIDDTVSITAPIEEAVPILEWAGTFIGMRSGFCDVVSSAKCRKIVLYPEADLTVIDYDRHRTDLEFSSFSRMDLAQDVEELEFSDVDNPEYWKKFALKVFQISAKMTV